MGFSHPQARPVQPVARNLRSRVVSIAGAAVLAVCLFGPGGSLARADTYDLTANITSFRSWIPAGNASLNAMVGNTALVDSTVFAGSYYGSAYYWSNTVLFAANSNTTAIDFGYDPAIFPSRGLNAFGVVPGLPVTVDHGVPFDLARVSFTNGQYYYKTEIGLHFVATDRQTGAINVYDDVAQVTANSTSPIYDPVTQQYNYDPYAEADFVTFTAHPEFGSIRVFDSYAQPPSNPGNVGSALLVAQIGSLDPLGFTAPAGGAFLDSSYTGPLADPHNQAVPEPAAGWLLVSALLCLLMAGRRAGGDAAKA